MSMELWDLLDKDRRPLGQTHPRGRQYPMPHGTYHTVVTVYTVDDRGRLLLTRRAACKGMYPGWWEVTGGSGIAGAAPAWQYPGAVRLFGLLSCAPHTARRFPDSAGGRNRCRLLGQFLEV